MRDYSRNYSPILWFDRLASADAARWVVAFEAARQHDWTDIKRTPDRRLSLQGRRRPDGPPHERPHLTFGRPGDDIATAVRTLNRQLSPAIFGRFRDEPAFGQLILLEVVRAMVGDDVDLAKGLLRRVIDATLGFTALATLMNVHPKSLSRMLSRYGNPSARHLAAVVARLADWLGVRFAVAISVETRSNRVGTILSHPS